MKRLHILVVPGYRLFPVDSGGSHRQLVFLGKQQEQHNIEIIVTPQSLPHEYLADFRKQFPNISLIQIGYKKRSFLWKWRDFFKKQTRKLSGKDHAYKLIKTRHINNLIIRDPFFVEEVQRIAGNKKYDIIQVDHSINMGLVDILPQEIAKVFVHYEISHTRIYSDLQALGYGPGYAQYISSAAQAIELTWLNKYQGIIVFCQEDKDLLESKGIRSSIQVARPFAYFKGELKKIYDPQMHPHLVFSGGESHFPNKEGLSWFLQEIFPLVQAKRKDVQLVVTGHWTEEFKKPYSGNHSIRFTGFVEDLDNVFKNGILIMPIRIGLGGIRVKATSAFGNGVPVVSTSDALSGIPHLKHNENIIIADNTALFAEGIQSLLDNPELRKKISERSFELARNEFDRGGFAEERNVFYVELAERNLFRIDS